MLVLQEGHRRVQVLEIPMSLRAIPANQIVRIFTVVIRILLVIHTTQPKVAIWAGAAVKPSMGHNVNGMDQIKRTLKHTVASCLSSQLQLLALCPPIRSTVWSYVALCAHGATRNNALHTRDLTTFAKSRCRVHSCATTRLTAAAWCRPVSCCTPCCRTACTAFQTAPPGPRRHRRWR